MAAKKNLGMGLDLLLTAVDEEKTGWHNQSIMDRAQTWYRKAVSEDEKGNVFEAYHLYRQVIDLLENPPSVRLPEFESVVSQSFNNAAIILYDAGWLDMACTFLRRAMEVYSENQTARENYLAIMAFTQAKGFE
ncbi:MAG: hypothetical protein ACOX6I_04105 [Syntrophomonadaceae bacterium]|jgi:tetratricopeptide (TPR) repeat protein